MKSAVVSRQSTVPHVLVTFEPNLVERMEKWSDDQRGAAPGAVIVDIDK